ncbi:MAG: hypothetical protein QME79_10120 [Bacillota bacterium]|nr:hypothetical protein [Bacillota bacterium]
MAAGKGWAVGVWKDNRMRDFQVAGADNRRKLRLTEMATKSG